MSADILILNDLQLDYFKASVFVAAIAYLLGSMPFGYILVKTFLKQDIRESGSGNIGATNVARSGAKGLALATLLLDAGKGFLAVVLVSWLSPEDPNRSYRLATIAALFVICGHIFPIWLKFKGGKGVATGLGAFLALSPKAVLASVLVFLIVFAVTRYVSLGSILAALVFPVAAYYLYPEMHSPLLFMVMIIASLLIVIKHHQNIRRLLAGTESRIGMKSA